MASYWLDSDFFIHSKNEPYGFEIAPGFWTFLEQKAIDGVIATSVMVYTELVEESDDELAKWARERRASGLFVEPDARVQERMSLIANFVSATYQPNQAAEFLKGADPWVIAHAGAHGGEVATREQRVPQNSKKAKIPNVADQFHVNCISPYDMLRNLGLSLVVRG